MYGLLASLGIEKGKPFAPDTRLQVILGQAAKLAREQMLVSAFAGDRPDQRVWPQRRWEWVGLRPESADFEAADHLDTTARDRWFIQAIITSPAMFRRSPGAGSLYYLAARDAQGAYLDGGQSYRLVLPTPIPAQLFWSVTAYDAETRSQVQAPQAKAALRSLYERFTPGADGKIELRFGPRPPKDNPQAWIQTVPDRGWFAYLRVYGPEAPVFDGRWMPGDFELVH
jgi:hypothetical protein